MAEIVFKSNLFSSPCAHHENHLRVVARHRGTSSNLLFPSLKSDSNLSLKTQFYGGINKFVAGGGKNGIDKRRIAKSMSVQMSIGIGKAQKWWEKGIQSNMIEITSAQHLVDSLNGAGDQLVVLAFFSPGCGGCKALHPKMCQLAEMNPDVKFLHVNHEEHNSMCHSLNVHVLPFFRFYRGAHGRLCSFSCTNATIKKFKDALMRHSPERCSIGPTKGLEEKELVALAANKELGFNYTPKPVEEEVDLEEQEKIPTFAKTSASSSSRSYPVPHLPLHLPLPLRDASTSSKEKLVTAGR